MKNPAAMEKIKEVVELSSSEMEMSSQQQYPQRSNKGGLVTMPFIIGKNSPRKNMDFVSLLLFFGFGLLIYMDGWCDYWHLCVAANEALARVATIGLLPNMILYLMGSYRLHLAKATQILFLFSATSNLTPLLGAFIADSHLGRFLAVGLGSIITFLVTFLHLLSFFQIPFCAFSFSVFANSRVQFRSLSSLFFPLLIILE